MEEKSADEIKVRRASALPMAEARPKLAEHVKKPTETTTLKRVIEELKV
jgi:hypothetical protein